MKAQMVARAVALAVGLGVTLYTVIHIWMIVGGMHTAKVTTEAARLQPALVTTV